MGKMKKSVAMQIIKRQREESFKKGMEFASDALARYSKEYGKPSDGTVHALTKATMDGKIESEDAAYSTIVLAEEAQKSLDK